MKFRLRNNLLILLIYQDFSQILNTSSSGHQAQRLHYIAIVINRQRVGVICEALDDFAHALRPAMADMVKPVDDEQHGFCVPFWKPNPMIDVGVTHALETAFDMIHKAFLFQVIVEVAEYQSSAENGYGTF
jgi:hypothetical protein